MHALQLDVPDEVLISLKETRSTISHEVRMAAAAKLFELGKLSTGRAAQLAGIPLAQFLSGLGRYHVSPFNQTSEQLEQDVQKA